uniref:WLM domain-containing protein n=1 Tax=viral metagenome TaxID=1070528 RepID=A0A6C0KM80_9ZZZZ
MSDLQNLLSNMMQNLKDTVAASSSYPLVDVKSNEDGRSYRVRDMPDKQQAADLLARVRRKISNLYNTLRDKFPSKPQIKQWIQNFEPSAERFMESTPDAEHTSYSVNKGEKIHLCLRQREGQNESLVEENVMVFVALHEMAHVITPTLGHGPDFWNNFGWLLKQAEAQGIYQYQDFKAHPVSYCGLNITDSPAYDPKKDGTDLSFG